MHQHITLEHYLGPYANHPAAQAVVVRNNAQRTCDLMNAICKAAEDDGVKLEDNPNTGTAISGQGNGGIRPPDSTVGATSSKHKDGNAGDRYDPRQALMRWVLKNMVKVQEIAKELGLEGAYFEHPQWTPTWCHIQTIPAGNPPRPEVLVFVPYPLDKVPPMCAALPEQKDAGITSFPFRKKGGGQ